MNISNSSELHKIEIENALLKQKVQKLEEELRLLNSLNDLEIVPGVCNTELFNRIVSNANEGILICDTEAKTIFINNRTSQLLGYSYEELIGKKVYDFMDDDAIKLAKMQLERRKQGYNDVYEQKLIKKNGSTLWIKLLASPILDKNGKMAASLGMFTDISQQKNVEQALKQSEDKFYSAFKSSPNALVISQLNDGTCLEVNDTFVKLTGWVKEEIIGKSSYEFNIFKNPKERELIAYIVRRDGYIRNQEVTLCNRAREEVKVLLSTEILSAGNEDLILTTIQDITQIKNFESNLNKSELRYHKLFNNKTNAIAHNKIISDENGIPTDILILQVNDAYTEITGMKKEDIEGKRLLELFPYLKEFSNNLIFNYSKVAFEDEEFSFESYDPALGKWISTYAYSPSYGEFTAIFRDISDRKRIEEELRSKVTEVEGILSCIPDGIIVYDTNGKITKLNKQAEKILKYPAELMEFNISERIGKRIVAKDQSGKVLSLEEFPAYRAAILAEHVTNEIYSWEQDDVTKWFIFNATPSFVNNKHAGAVLSMVDVTARIETEQQLLAERELFQGIFDNIPVMVTIIDPDLKTFKFNKELKKILGWTESDTIDGKFMERVYPVEEYRNEVSEYIQSLEPGWREWSVTTKEGKKVDSLWANIKLSSGVLLGIGIDIRERKEYFEKLRQSEERFRTLADNMSQMAWISDECGKVIWFNKRWHDFTGVSVEDLYNGGEKKIHHPDYLQAVLRSYQTAIENKEAWEETYPLKGVNGEYRWFLARALPIFDENNKIKLWFGTNTDITEKIESEKALQLQNEELKIAKEKAEESDRFKSAFIANISHEIRTPMSGILGFADLLKLPATKCDSHETYINAIITSGKRMLNIVNDLINISKIEAGVAELQKEATNIPELMQKLHTFFLPEASKKKVTLTQDIRLSAEVEYVETDKTKLSQIIINLVKNALKFTSAGNVELGCSVENGAYQFYVKDTGTGIKKEIQQKIFDRFEQGEIFNIGVQEGVGLGLAISKAFVKLLGGEIWVESAPNEGSVFYFTHPLQKVQKIITSADTVLNMPRVEASPFGEVLIAEDEEFIYQLLDIILKQKNIKTVHARNGQIAIEMVQSNPNISLILMDGRMPEMHGVEATKIIKSLRPHIPIIALSAMAHETDIKEALKAGCVDYVTKPIDIEDMLSKISKYTAFNN